MSESKLRCGEHHVMYKGAWLNTNYLEWLCDLCKGRKKTIAFDCPQCVVSVCVGCVEAHGDHVSFALRQAQSGRTYDGQDTEELKHFQRAQAHVAKMEEKEKKTERMVEELQRQLALYKSVSK